MALVEETTLLQSPLQGGGDGQRIDLGPRQQRGRALQLRRRLGQQRLQGLPVAGQAYLLWPSIRCRRGAQQKTQAIAPTTQILEAQPSTSGPTAGQGEGQHTTIHSDQGTGTLLAKDLPLHQHTRGKGSGVIRRGLARGWIRQKATNTGDRGSTHDCRGTAADGLPRRRSSNSASSSLRRHWLAMVRAEAPAMARRCALA